MIFVIPGRKKLSKEVVNGIKNRQFTEEQLSRVYGIVKEEYASSKKGFKIAMIVTIVIDIIMAVLSIPVINRMGIMPFISMFFFLTAVLVLILFFIKIFYVDGMKKQFLKALKTGYPERIMYYDIN